VQRAARLAGRARGATMPALAQLLRAASAQGAPFEPRAACAIAVRICDVLDAPHGGLAPSAIHISWEGAITLPSRARAPSAVLAYMAPERLAGHPPSTRSDVHALALILCEMVVGRPLPRDAVERAVRTGARDLFLEEDVPVELINVIERATSRDPRDRHATAREMSAWLTLAEDESGGPMSNDDLADWLSRRFPRDLSAHSIHPTSRTPRRLLLGAAALAISAVAVGVAMAQLAGPFDESKPSAVAPMNAPDRAAVMVDGARSAERGAGSAERGAAVMVERHPPPQPVEAHVAAPGARANADATAASAEHHRAERRARRRRTQADLSSPPSNMEGRSPSPTQAGAEQKAATCPMPMSAGSRPGTRPPAGPASTGAPPASDLGRAASRRTQDAKSPSGAPP
jgi:hypothetical protein